MFKKKPSELKTNMDRWLYLLKHLSTMDKLPSFLDKRIFGRIFDIDEVGKLKPEQRMSYEDSLKRKMDLASADRTSRNIGLTKGLAKGLAKGRAEGLAKGRAEGRVEGKAEGIAEGIAEDERNNAVKNAIALKKMGLSTKDIARVTDLSIQEIEKL